ncbi:MAG: hypothetical protein FWB96_10845 [Defluviitaleaceae bacterium]|nr:hypothetical protein [Defluviitaleaceae bacterium]MCL2263470.1 hypothetical protein [Defluviitaleaceae bacterium]
MAISQIVDDQIKQIRKERAELDELRASLERKEEELFQREQEQDDTVGSSGDRRESLLAEIADLTAEVNRLRTERDASIESFGGEISKVHSEKTAESAALVKQLQGEINFLLKGKTDLEDEVERLNEKLSGLDEKAKHELERMVEEKETLLRRTREERETELKEINLSHSVAVAELERVKKEIENDITALEQTKTIEWNKIQAEVSRYKTSQLAELDAKREQFLADMEKENELLTGELRAKERKNLSEISAERREWEKEILKFQTEKQKILDDIKLLEYDYEKVKSANILKAEKARADEEKTLTANRAEALVKLEEEQAAITAEFRISAAEQKTRLRDEVAAMEKEVARLEVKKTAVIGEINSLEVKFEQQRTENETVLQSLRTEKLKEIDEARLAHLQEIENIRQERIAALEKAFLEKSGEFELSRAHKLDECRKDIKIAEDKLKEILQNNLNAEKKVEVLKAQAAKIAAENDTALQAAKLEKQTELEKMANDKLAEIEEICTHRIASANARVRKIEADGTAAEEKISAEIAESTEALLELRRMIVMKKLELDGEDGEPETGQ